MAVDDEENRVKALLRNARKQRDAEDFGNETAGREVGRINRFLPESAQLDTQKARKERLAGRLSRLALWMQNAEYVALYNQTTRLAKEYVAKTEAGLETSRAALSAAGQALEAITDKAAKLHPDGIPVFRDKDSNAVRADGTPLTPEEAATVVWPYDAPAYEEYLKAKKAHDGAQVQLRAWHKYQLYIGGVQNRLNDADNPLAPEELREIQRNVQERIPTANAADTKIALQTDRDLVRGTSDIDKPKL